MTDVPSSMSTTDFRAAVEETLGELPPREVLAATVRRLRNIADRYGDQLDRRLAGGWSIAQTIHHFADSEAVFAVRIKSALLREEPELAGYDHDAWLDRIGSEAGDTAATLDRFELLRLDNLGICARLSPAELRRVSRHVLRGPETIQELVMMRAGHDLIHLREIESEFPPDGAEASPLRGVPLDKRDPFDLPAKSGHLIVVCGIDGAGKTSQALDLVDWLRAAGQRAEYVKPVGIRSELDHLAHRMGRTDHIDLLGPDTARLLGATVRWKSMVSACARLADPDLWLVMDRYVYCEYAATRQQHAGNEPLIREMYAGLPTPDITFFLDLPPKEAHRRIRSRNLDSEDLGFLEEFDQGYRSLPEMPSFTHVDAAASFEAVRDHMRGSVRGLLAADDGPR